VVTDAAKWEVDTERESSEFDAAILWEDAGKGAGGCSLLFCRMHIDDRK
jgi:hypothetical protein